MSNPVYWDGSLSKATQLIYWAGRDGIVEDGVLSIKSSQGRLIVRVGQCVIRDKSGIFYVSD